MAEAVLLEPLEDHPEELRKFREETLYAPLEGSQEAKRKAQSDALAAMGIDMANMKVGSGMGRQAKRVAAKAAADKAKRKGGGDAAGRDDGTAGADAPAQAVAGAG